VSTGLSAMKVLRRWNKAPKAQPMPTDPISPLKKGRKPSQCLLRAESVRSRCAA
jgi:hypothetical protein